MTRPLARIDLVREQLRVAAGEKLHYGQEQVGFHGHAIEVRVNAEDPAAGFLPSTGTIQNLRLPGGPWVRIDSCMYSGMEVGTSYDPMLAKIIVWAHDRQGAIARMRRTLQELNVGGVRTGVPAALAVLEDARFASGDFDTHLLEDLDLSARHDEARAAALAAALFRWHAARRRALAAGASDRTPWLRRAVEARASYPAQHPSARGPA